MKLVKNILDLSFEEFLSFLKSIDQKPFHARQVFEWIYHKSVLDFDAMRNISKGLREHLKNQFSFPEIDCIEKSSESGGTVKYLFRLSDGEKIETVLIPTAKRLTICLSVQAGCKFACAFCASGIGGWKRNLSSGEILMQILKVQSLVERRVSHVVFMGTGEPLDNWDQVKKAIEVMNSSEGLNIAARRITVSTCGIPEKIEAMSAFGRQIELAVSLHGYNDATRGRLMPINKQYPLKDLLKACENYVRKTNRQITFEYIVIPDVTMNSEAPKELGRLLSGLLCKINLIPYNPIREFKWKSPSRKDVYHFRDALIAKGLYVTIRWSKGAETQGACGQLRRQSSINSKEAS